MVAIGQIAFWLVIWAGCIIATLAIRNVPLGLEHGICGPWGCGPPTQALIACHLAWMVVLMPPAAWLAWSGSASKRMIRKIGMLLILIAGAAILAIIAGQRITWWQQAEPWQRQYFWQRCGFWLAAAVDLPITQSLIVGVVLRLTSRTFETDVAQRDPDPA